MAPMFKKNMNSADRLVRIVAGIILIYYGFVEAGWVSNAIVPLLLGVIGVANIVFASAGFCPPYTLAGYNFANQQKQE